MENGEAASGTSSRAGLWMILLGFLTFFYLGPITAVPALIWSRRLRPFSKATRVGYWLCWTGMAFYPSVMMLLAFAYLGMAWQWPYQLGAIVFCDAAWLWIFLKFIPRPAGSKGGAVLIALGGTLLVGPALFISDVFVYVLPTIIGLPWMIFGSTRPFTFIEALMIVAGTCSAFAAHLAVYWPVRNNADVSAC